MSQYGFCFTTSHTAQTITLPSSSSTRPLNNQQLRPADVSISWSVSICRRGTGFPSRDAERGQRGPGNGNIQPRDLEPPGGLGEKTRPQRLDPRLHVGI